MNWGSLTLNGRSHEITLTAVPLLIKYFHLILFKFKADETKINKPSQPKTSDDVSL